MRQKIKGVKISCRYPRIICLCLVQQFPNLFFEGALFKNSVQPRFSAVNIMRNINKK